MVLCGDAAHAMPPFLGQGANQGIRDADLLARTICRYNRDAAAGGLSDDGSDDLTSRLRSFQRARWTQTTQISLKSIFLGYLETGSVEFPLLSAFRDRFFSFAGKVGLAKYVWVDGATPKPKVGTEGCSARDGWKKRIEDLKLFMMALNDPAFFMDDDD